MGIYGRALALAVTAAASLDYAAAASLQTANNAPAADATTSSPAASEGAADSDIVVTARRRAESVMAVPAAIVAVSGTQLNASGIKQITDLQFAVPGLTVVDGSGYTQAFIRGIGNAIFVGADPSVATFIDDVPRIYGTVVNNLVDVTRVEVLKGAQGGLYGRNATGGVINIISGQPSTDGFHADFRFDAGERNTFEEAGYVNVPINDWAALSVAGERRTHDGYIKNIAPSAPYTAAMFPVNGAGGVPGNASYVGGPAATAAFLNSGIDNGQVDNENFYSFDGKLLIRPSRTFKLTIAGDYSKKNDTSGNNQYNQTPGVVQETLGGYLGAFLGASPQLPPGFVIGNTPKFTVADGNPGFVKLKDYGVSGTAVLMLPGVDLTSITAYRAQTVDYIEDIASASVPLLGVHSLITRHYFYQELRALSTFAGPVHLIAGGTYLQSHFEGISTLSFLVSQLSASASSPFAAVNIPLNHALDQVRNYSVYAQGDYDLSPELSFSASGRFVHESNAALFPGDTTGTPASSHQASEQKFLPSANLSYKVDGGVAYVRWARGFKAGGVNPVAAPNSFVVCTPSGSTNCQSAYDQGSVFKGEQVDTFEGGVHVPLTADHSLTSSSAIFYNAYSNLQVLAHVAAQYSASIIEAIINAGSARTYGVESALDWRVAPALTLTASGAYLNAKYTQFGVGQTTPQIITPFNRNGTQLPNAPKVQLSFSANLDQPVSNRLRIVGNVLLNHTSSTILGLSGQPDPTLPNPLPNIIGPAYWLANARVGVRTRDNKYELAVYATNLFNTGYYTFASGNASTGNYINWGNPRIIGVELSGKF